MSRIVPLVLAGLLVAGCSVLPGPPDDQTPAALLLENTTPLDLVVLVNRRRFDAPHGDGMQLDAARLGPRPWDVQVFTAGSGRLVAELNVEAVVGTCQENADGSFSCGGAADLVDLSCGRIAVSVGVPSFPAPAPDAGQPGDCEP